MAVSCMSVSLLVRQSISHETVLYTDLSQEHQLFAIGLVLGFALLLDHE